MKDIISNRASNISITIASMVIIVVGIIAAKSIITSILLALFISVICMQPILWLEKRKVPYVLAILIVLSTVTVLGIMLGGIITNSLSLFMKELPQYEGQIEIFVVNFLQRFKDITEIDLVSLLEENHDSGNVINFITATMGGLGRILSDSFLVLFITIFLLLEAKFFLRKLKTIETKYDISLGHLDEIGPSIRRYLSLKTLISIITGFFIWGWLSILGVDYPILWGVIAFLLNYIPNIGSLVSVIPAALLSLLQLGIGGMVWTIAGYLLINVIIGSVIEPKVMGKGLGISTLAVFLSLIIWGLILGPIGMFLSVPLTVAMKIILDENNKTKWIAILLEGEDKKLLRST